jgi:hypothetical protein
MAISLDFLGTYFSYEEGKTVQRSPRKCDNVFRTFSVLQNMTAITTVLDRSKLSPRREPYWSRVMKGCYLGFRKMTASYQRRVDGQVSG